eukprot:TRINITY_DN6932_c0_g5_i1.p1 TRINITY_DN6932_c0_g5~~TRINITY_DN6932_c0_g5_i1.p1  ORF type:complete len:130 (-),score=13.43 TRINITY_DN6932_c0_g5_i1:3-392(-)
MCPLGFGRKICGGLGFIWQALGGNRPSFFKETYLSIFYSTLFLLVQHFRTTNIQFRRRQQRQGCLQIATIAMRRSDKNGNAIRNDIRKGHSNEQRSFLPGSDCALTPDTALDEFVTHSSCCCCCCCCCC